jgi:hypothetical protein
VTGNAEEHETSSTGRTVSEAGDLQRFLFAPPQLYPLGLDAIGQVFRSRVGSAPIEVIVPESPPHSVQPAAASARVPLEQRSRWIVPRSLELAVAAGTELNDPTFGLALRRWWALTTDWLAAWVGEPPGNDMSLPRLVHPLDAEVPEQPAPAGFMMLYGLAGEAHASGAQFGRALQLAGESAELPAAYSLLLRAGSAHALNEHRVTVMEACSAAEVAVGDAVERALTNSGCPVAFVEGVVRRARGIRSAHGVLLELDVPCGVEKGDVTRLAQMRNAAAHGASRIDWAAAHDALTISRTLISTLLGPARPA